MIRGQRVELDVTGAAPAGVRTLVADVFAGDDVAPDTCAAIVVCLPGGGMARGYFDLDVEGETGTFSMARALAAEGLVVVTLDLPGTGESDVPTDGYTLTPDAVADTVDRATIGLVDAARAGELAPDVPALPDVAVVGLGHSAGALIACYQQARHRRYDALALLGFAGRGLVQHLTDEERACIDDGHGLRDRLPQLVANRFGEPLPRSQTSGSDLLVRVPISDAAREALLGCGTRLIGCVGLTSMVRGASADELRAVDVPLFLGVGDADITGPADRLPGDFPGARDLTLYVLAESGHNHNVAPTRQLLWHRIASWIRSVASVRGSRPAPRSRRS
jgi:pimeloyl-ACP methyl ester carboxylesterase